MGGEAKGLFPRMQTDGNGRGQPDQMRTCVTAVIAIAGVLRAVLVSVRADRMSVVDDQRGPMPGEGPAARETEHGENQQGCDEAPGHCGLVDQ
jgi:hypothetical protein